MIKHAALVVGALVACAAQGATLVASPSVLVTQINTNKAQQSLLSEQREFDLKPGVHSIAFRYEQLFELAGDDHEFVRSSPMVAVIELTGEDKQVTLSPTEQPRKLEQAKQFAEQASVAIKIDGKLNQTVTADSNNTSIVTALSNLVDQVSSGISASDEAPADAAPRQKLISSFDLLWQQTNASEKQYIRSVVNP